MTGSFLLDLSVAAISVLTAVIVTTAALLAFQRPVWGLSYRGVASRGWKEITVRVMVHNCGFSPIRLDKTGHSVVFPMQSGGSKHSPLSIIDLGNPGGETISVPPFGFVEVGTSIISPMVSMTAGKGLQNEPYFEIRLKDQLGRQAPFRFLLPDTLAKAIPNPKTGKWDYPSGESLTLNPRPYPYKGRWQKWLQARSTRLDLLDVIPENVWPNFPTDPEPPESPAYHYMPPVDERESVVAFIDILGFKELMNSDDNQRRSTAIRLLERLVENSSNHGIEVHDLGLGQQIVVNPEVSTFSDNVVLSFPLRGVSYPGPDGQMRTFSAESFMDNLVTLCISTYWQGLNLGLLFRGGISIGRLYHAANVVAGSGLVKAVALEHDACWPRIAVDPLVLQAKDDRGRPIVSESIRQCIIQDPDDGAYQLDTLSFHIGVWWDYFHFRKGKPEGTMEEVRLALQTLKKEVDHNIDELGRTANSMNETDRKPVLKAADKWKWFKRRFEEAQQGDDWRRVWDMPVKAPECVVKAGDADIVRTTDSGLERSDNE